MSFSELDKVYPSLQGFLMTVLRSKVGVFAREIDLLAVASGRPALDHKSKRPIGDRFKLSVPISDYMCRWEVIFNCSYPNCPPDFELNDSEFLDCLTLDTDEAERLIPTLAKWNCKQDNALYNVITELRSTYLKYQVEKLLEINDQLGYEYNSLMDESKVPRENIEVIILPNTIRFLIKLTVDLHSPDLDDHRAALSIVCSKYGNQRNAKVITTPNAIKNLGITLEIPRNIRSEESFADYFTQVTASVESQVLEAVIEKENKRKTFVMNLLKLLGRQVLSFDALEYYSASFLLEKDDFVCILDVKIPPEFPNMAPRYRLLSIYNRNDPDDTVMHLPFNDNWDTSTMVDQAIQLINSKYIKELRDYTLLTFQVPK